MVSGLPRINTKTHLILWHTQLREQFHLLLPAFPDQGQHCMRHKVRTQNIHRQYVAEVINIPARVC